MQRKLKSLKIGLSQLYVMSALFNIFVNGVMSKNENAWNRFTVGKEGHEWYGIYQTYCM